MILVDAHVHIYDCLDIQTFLDSALENFKAEAARCGQQNSFRGEDLASVEKNLRNAIELYLEDIREHPDTVIFPISTEELIQFFRDTEPEWYKEPDKAFLIRPLEVHEVPSYA